MMLMQASRLGAVACEDEDIQKSTGPVKQSPDPLERIHGSAVSEHRNNSSYEQKANHVRLLHSGDSFGEKALDTYAKRTATALVTKECHLMTIDRGAIQSLISNRKMSLSHLKLNQNLLMPRKSFVRRKIQGKARPASTKRNWVDVTKDSGKNEAEEEEEEVSVVVSPEDATFSSSAGSAATTTFSGKSKIASQTTKRQWIDVANQDTDMSVERQDPNGGDDNEGDGEVTLRRSASNSSLSGQSRNALGRVNSAMGGRKWVDLANNPAAS